jgi:hypothetical protein
MELSMTKELQLVKLNNLDDADRRCIERAMRRSGEGTARKAVLYILRDYFNVDRTIGQLRMDFEAEKKMRIEAESELAQLKDAIRILKDIGE